MKPRPTAPKEKREEKRSEEPPKAREPDVPMRTIFVKDDGLSIEGFASFQEASDARAGIGEDNDERRTRVRFRNRTGLWDILVKVAKRVPLEPPTGE